MKENVRRIMVFKKIWRAMRPNKKGVGGPGGKENSLKVVIRHKIEGVAL